MPAAESSAALRNTVSTPAFRQALTSARVMAVPTPAPRDAGVTTVFLSAADDAAAAIYRRVGFRDVATACILAAGDE